MPTGVSLILTYEFPAGSDYHKESPGRKLAIDKELSATLLATFEARFRRSWLQFDFGTSTANFATPQEMIDAIFDDRLDKLRPQSKKIVKPADAGKAPIAARYTFIGPTEHRVTNNLKLDLDDGNPWQLAVTGATYKADIHASLSWGFDVDAEVIGKTSSNDRFDRLEWLIELGSSGSNRFHRDPKTGRILAPIGALGIDI